MLRLTGRLRSSHRAAQVSSGGQKLEAELNRLGAEGFELAAVFLDANLHREKDGHVLVFKRRSG